MNQNSFQFSSRHQAIHEDEDESMEEGTKRVNQILGEGKAQLYTKILQLVMADGAYTEGKTSLPPSNPFHIDFLFYWSGMKVLAARRLLTCCEIFCLLVLHLFTIAHLLTNYSGLGSSTFQ